MAAPMVTVEVFKDFSFIKMTPRRVIRKPDLEDPIDIKSMSLVFRLSRFDGEKNRERLFSMTIRRLSRKPLLLGDLTPSIGWTVVNHRPPYPTEVPEDSKYHTCQLHFASLYQDGSSLEDGTRSHIYAKIKHEAFCREPAIAPWIIQVQERTRLETYIKRFILNSSNQDLMEVLGGEMAAYTLREKTLKDMREKGVSTVHALEGLTTVEFDVEPPTAWKKFESIRFTPSKLVGDDEPGYIEGLDHPYFSTSP